MTEPRRTGGRPDPDSDPAILLAKLEHEPAPSPGEDRRTHYERALSTTDLSEAALNFANDIDKFLTGSLKKEALEEVHAKFIETVRLFEVAINSSRIVDLIKVTTGDDVSEVDLLTSGDPGDPDSDKYIGRSDVSSRYNILLNTEKLSHSAAELANALEAFLDSESSGYEELAKTYSAFQAEYRGFLVSVQIMEIEYKRLIEE